MDFVHHLCHSKKTGNIATDASQFSVLERTPSWRDWTAAVLLRRLDRKGFACGIKQMA